MCIIDTRLLSIWILSSFVIEFCFGRWLISLCISLFLFLSFNKSGSGLSLFPRCGISGSLMNPGVFNEVSNWMFGTQIPPSHVQASIVVQLMLLGSCSWPTWVEFCSVPDRSPNPFAISTTHLYVKVACKPNLSLPHTYYLHPRPNPRLN